MKGLQAVADLAKVVTIAVAAWRMAGAYQKICRSTKKSCKPIKELFDLVCEGGDVRDGADASKNEAQGCRGEACDADEQLGLVFLRFLCNWLVLFLLN